MLEIDGSQGGGQLLRSSLALSALTGKPFIITNIRSKRDSPGLKAQHSKCVEAVQQLCDATVEGNFVGSTELKFVPGKLNPKSLEIDIGTAGSITLLLQSLLLPCMFGGKRIKLTVKGGTDVQWSMPIDYFREVVMHYFRPYCDLDLRILNRGFYPKGQGCIELKFKQNEFREPLNLVERKGDIIVNGIACSSKDLMINQVSERMGNGAKQLLSKYLPRMRHEYTVTESTGCVITVWVRFGERFVLGADDLGEIRKPAELVGKIAADRLLKEIDSGACVDHHCADNLIPLMGIVGGKIHVSEITEHTKTNIAVTEMFTGKKFVIDGNVIQV